MILPTLIKIAVRQFAHKMLEFSENWDTDKLTAESAQQVTKALKESLSLAGRAAFESFIRSYDICDPVIQVNGRLLRWNTRSPKTFLTYFALMTIHRSLYQADASGKCFNHWMCLGPSMESLPPLTCGMLCCGAGCFVASRWGQVETQNDSYRKLELDDLFNMCEGGGTAGRSSWDAR